MHTSVYVLAGLFLLGILHFGNPLECYRCIEKEGGDCDHPENHKNFINPCQSPDNVTCYTHISIDNGTRMVHRGCGTASPCPISNAQEPSRNDSSRCDVCSSNLCNNKNAGFSNFQLNFSSILLSSILYVFITKVL